MKNTDNELIAEFMGLELVVPKLTVYKPYYRERNPDGTLNRDYQFDKLLYDKSWDRLMPVVEKICKVCKPDSLEHYWWNNAPVSDIRIFRETLNETFFAVVTFIKWYIVRHLNQ